MAGDSNHAAVVSGNTRKNGMDEKAAATAMYPLGPFFLGLELHHDYDERMLDSSVRNRTVQALLVDRIGRRCRKEP